MAYIQTDKDLKDPKFNNVIVGKFINYVMLDGKKSLAQKIVYSAIESLDSKIKENDGLDSFLQAVENVKPLIRIISKRVGGQNYSVPTQVTPKKAQELSFRWIIQTARKRNEHTMAQKLAAELLAAFKKEGTSMKKREETHRMAEANKAFAHLG